MSSLLEVTDVSKRFGPTIALDRVCLKAQAGRVLALIGENGAGKSTLLKTLSGAHRPDSGAMLLDGQRYAPSGPINARQRGVAIVYQELTLAPDLSIEDNLMLGRSGTGLGTLLRTAQRTIVRDAMERVGLGHLSPKARTGDQSIATCQLIEVARALISDAKILLLDEPTSSLPAADVERLFEIIGQLRDRGMAIIYISHFLEEVRRVADDYAVLRDGHSVGEGRLDEVTDDQIISMMVGRDVDDLFPHVPHDVGMPHLTLKNVSASPAPTDVSLRIYEGEIFGVAGLVGAGRTELLRCLYALEPTYQGHVQLEGRILPHRVGARRKAGFGLLSEDRKTEGLAQNLSVTENVCMGNHHRFSLFGWINLRSRRKETERLIHQVEIKAHSADQSVSELSGGNQQKVAFARLLAQHADVYLLDEPTKGIDIGTKAEIYRMIGELAASGRTIVFVSSYLPELLAVCDRIGVMARGQLIEVRKSKEWTEEDLMAAAVS
ncbi:sugar ABC transporter ATP-binding protein [Roseiconus lacunae]|uniref:Sugar ABC transporter ATP-binding protein n=1 Tax=Roseiconus lacunae TaxID=2605694 RepID=A0ABT7PIT3_9BACT|nr:sugar ABC transporter ATP-binding protein [Roseiconus lacunae]MDM4016410.1 sugar ABC transporter ATP-binding protein [Roseiconus lacunae]